MVKIHTRTIAKKYRDKVYCYKQNIILLPLNSNEELAPFLGQQLELNIKDGTIILTPKKSVEEAQDGERN